MLNESKSNVMFINFKKKSTPFKFVFNFDNFPIESIDNFLNLRVIFGSSFSNRHASNAVH